MKNLLFTLLLTVIVSTTMFADEQDTLWFRIAGAGVQELDFTPDDKYVIAWANGIEFWEVEQGVKEFYIRSEVTGDYNYNEQFLVFVQDSTPKLLNWQTIEVVEGFQKENFRIDRILTAKSKNEFMAKNIGDDKKIYFWDIDSKRKVDSFDVIDKFQDVYEWHRSVLDYGYIGNNDEYFYIKYSDYNSKRILVPPTERRTNDFYHIYDRETKELKDSIFRFQSTIKDNGIYVDKLKVMNDRTKLAWNDEGGVINFYEYRGNGLFLYDNFVFSNNKYSQVNDLDFIDDENIIGVASSTNFKIINLINKEILQSYDFAVEYVSLPKNAEFFTISGGSFVSLRDKMWLISKVENSDINNVLLITPNPATNSIRISFNFYTPFNYKLSILDISGRELSVIDEGFPSNLTFSFEYNISNFPAGLYFIKLEYDGKTVNNKFIKE